MGASELEDVIGKTYVLGEFLSQPGKDLVTRLDAAIAYDRMNRVNTSKPPVCYRVTDMGCGMGFSGYDQDAMPEDAIDSRRIFRDGAGRSCIRAHDAFAPGTFWPAGRDEIFMECSGECSPRMNPARATRWDSHVIDPDDESSCWGLYDEFDVIVSTGRLQWAANLRQAIGNLLIPLRSGGYLAATMPKLMSAEAFLNMAFYRVEAYAGPAPDIIAEPVSNMAQTLSTLSAVEYAEALSACTEAYRMWETTYYQRIRGTHDLEEWYARSGWQELLASMAYHGGMGEPVMKEELFKWLRAGNPTPVGSDLLLSYPFISFIARKE